MNAFNFLVRLPGTVSDDGTVGDAPVTLGQALAIPFTIVAPPLDDGAR